MSRLSKQIEKLMTGYLLKTVDRTKNTDLEKMSQLISEGSSAAEETKAQKAPPPLFNSHTANRLKAFKEKYRKQLDEILQASPVMDAEINKAEAEWPAIQELEVQEFPEAQQMETAEIHAEADSAEISQIKALQKIEEAALVSPSEKIWDAGSGLPFFDQAPSAASYDFTSLILYDENPSYTSSEEEDLFRKAVQGEHYGILFESQAKSKQPVCKEIWDKIQAAVPKGYHLPDQRQLLAFTDMLKPQGMFQTKEKSQVFFNPAIWGAITAHVPEKLQFPDFRFTSLFPKKDTSLKSAAESFHSKALDIVSSRLPGSYDLPSSMLKVLEPMAGSFYSSLFTSADMKEETFVDRKVWEPIKRNAPSFFRLPDKATLSVLEKLEEDGPQSLFEKKKKWKLDWEHYDVWKRIAESVPKKYQLPASEISFFSSAADDEILKK
ncbi:hypothetical protein LRR81_00260 [Metabacillus sp. GX 13764]|uniref:hypothetical protein n=1 Tax=Metabacillus kandeliae TaxID=2900151 RepID=UPI001E4DC107|nr:hypothetical protein [Metabacillus kandeliae]MCD7032640.1 hypothetical protein [Metabacillus kandeliae]